jgi:hypothetical protein
MSIKKFSTIASIALAALLFFGCCSEVKYGAFEPKAEQGDSNPNAYAGYIAAMRRYDGFQMAYEWQRANPKLVAESVKKEVLKEFVKSPEAADKLLAKIGTSYDGDPVALTQIAAVTQLVMTPKCPKAPKCRKLWVAALKRARAKTDDGYVKVFCDQQLRICE